MLRPVCCACLLALSVLAAPHVLLAQGGGRGARGAGRPTICVHDCNQPNSSSDDDTDKVSLKNFQQLLAVQATPQQSAAFTIVVQDTQAASAELHKLRESAEKSPGAKELAAQIPALDEAFDKIRQGNHDFLASFTAKQQSGLKLAAKKLERVDAELTVQRKAFDESVQSAGPEAIAKSGANLDVALDGVQSAQLALGGEMSIGSTSEEQATNFDIPEVRTSAKFSGETVYIPTSGIATRVSSSNGQRLRLSLVSDLSGLQENTAGLLRATLNHAPRCGDRIEVEDAALTPVSPVSVVVDVRLHVERWICPVEAGDAREIAADDASFDVKLTPSIINNGGVTLDSQIANVETEGALLHQDFASGDLGLALGRKITAFVSSMVTQGVDLKTVLPPAAQAAATIQRAEFQDGGAGRVILVLDGQLQFSDAQAQQFAVQLATASGTP